MGMKILIVDDDPMLKESLGELLSDYGHQDIRYSAGPEALSVYQEEWPEVVLVDIRMPGLDGIELLKRIRRLDPQARVILMTGYADVDTAIEAINHGACGYFRKPVDVPALVEVLQNIDEQNELEEDSFQKGQLFREAFEQLTQAYQALQAMMYRPTMTYRSSVNRLP